MLLEELVVKLMCEADIPNLRYIDRLLDAINKQSKRLQARTAIGLDTTQVTRNLVRLDTLLNNFAEQTGLDIETVTGDTVKRVSRMLKNVKKQVEIDVKELKRISDIKPGTSVDSKGGIKYNYGVEKERGRVGSQYRINTALLDTFNQKAELLNFNLGGIIHKIWEINPALGAVAAKVPMLAALSGVSFSIHSYLQMSDQLKTIEGQIKNVTKGEQETLRVEKEIYAMAGRTRQSYAESANLFTSVSRSAGELGKSTDDILKFTEDVSNAMLVGGGSAQSQQAALIQLGQALGSGTLRGDELNSIMEQAPKLAQTIATGMGTTIGNLRKMGSEGKLTAKDVFDAVRSQSENLKKDLGNMPWTVAQASTRARDSVAQLFFTIESKLKFGDKISKTIAAFADGLDKITVKLKEMPLNEVVNWLKLIATVALSTGVVLKASVISNALIYGTQTLISLLGITSFGFKGAAAAAGIFRAASIKAAVASAGAWVTAATPIVAIIALIVVLVLTIEDFVGWMNGKDSIFGRTFGNFPDAVGELSHRWEVVKQQWAEAWRWLTGSNSSLVQLIAGSEILNNIWKTIADSTKSFFENIAKAIDRYAGWKPGEAFRRYFDNPNEQLAKITSDNTSGGYNNNSTNTQNVTFNISGAKNPQETAQVVADKFTPITFGDLGGPVSEAGV